MKKGEQRVTPLILRQTKTLVVAMLLCRHYRHHRHHDASLSSADNNRLENVLILQGGGSLGAFGCGVFKALANNNIKLDIIAGTSIGGINAAIIAWQ